VDDRDHVAAADVELDDDAARLLVAVDERGAAAELEAGDVAERDELAGLGAQGQGGEGPQVAGEGRGRP
jgi:hypothetical protein